MVNKRDMTVNYVLDKLNCENDECKIYNKNNMLSDLRANQERPQPTHCPPNQQKS